MAINSFVPVLCQVFKLFKTNRTHMMLACALDNPAQIPGNILSVRSQQNFLAKGAKHMTGAVLLTASILLHSTTRRRVATILLHAATRRTALLKTHCVTETPQI